MGGILSIAGNVRCVPPCVKKSPTPYKSLGDVFLPQVIHYSGSKLLRRQQNTMAGSLKHLVFLGKFTGNLPTEQITTVIVNYCAVVLLVRRGPLGGVPKECPRKWRCSGECSRGSLRDPSGLGLRSVKKVSWECSRVSSGCSGPLFDTLETLSRHLLNTPGLGARRVPETPPRPYRANGRGRSGGQTAGGDPKAFPQAQAASLCSASIEGARKCLQG